MQGFFKRARLRALRARTALACLTLSLVNNYPMLALGQELEFGDLSVDALFDFEVPVSVVSNGVDDAFSGLADEDVEWDEDRAPDAYAALLESVGADPDEWLSESYWSATSTNGMQKFGGTNVGWTEYVDRSLDLGGDISAAVASPSNFNGTMPIDSLPDMYVDELPDFFVWLDRASPPESFGTVLSTPVISDAFPSDFWLSQCTIDMIWGFDGGGFDAWVGSIVDSDTPYLAWVRPAWSGICRRLKEFFDAHPNGTRPYLRFVAVVLYWVAAYRYFVKRIVFVIETVFEAARQ